MLFGYQDGARKMEIDLDQKESKNKSSNTGQSVGSE